ncbi:insulin-like peptide INSL5 [Tupaia chinensis]|uniref:insulin-like peptide INSL5 n=1 Tax=Tupaia chinensis TaxID=246437 RepID=UPI0003C914B4|nr:insulin-like peptide INSL5 [Tupaia chinensis]
MKGSIFVLFLFSVLFVISEVRSEDLVKLCGREYIRTFIYICASSRWRRSVEGNPQVQQAERQNLQLPKHEVSMENAARNFPKMDFLGEERLQGGQVPTEEGLWKSKEHSVMLREDLQTLCCTDGCSMADMSRFC